MPAVMTNDQNANGVTHYSKNKMVRKTTKINSPNVPFTNRERFRPLRRLYHEMPQLGIEFICKFRCRYFLVIGHDRIDIRINLRMKDEPHQVSRRRSIRLSSSLSEIAEDASALSSASRRRASAIPSSSS